jgi:PAS domain-containing protein
LKYPRGSAQRARAPSRRSLGRRREAGRFTAADVDLFASLARAISQAIENASLFQSVRTRQQELQESHSRLQAVINGILHPIYTIDERWRLLAVNRHKTDSLGVEPSGCWADLLPCLLRPRRTVRPTAR